MTQLISLVIPTLNEESKIELQLKYLKTLKGNFEIIISDGESSDNTIKIAKKYKVKVVNSQRGRGIQLNAGAKLAKGEILLFLHTDTILPKTFYEDVINEINKGYEAGGFFIRFDHPDWKFRIIETLVNLKAKLLGVKYGDQTIWTKTNLFKKLGKFPDIVIMEDYEFTKKIKKSAKTSMIKHFVITSPRKFLKMGILKAYFLHGWLQFIYMLGVKPEKIYQKYYGTPTTN